VGGGLGLGVVVVVVLLLLHTGVCLYTVYGRVMFYLLSMVWYGMVW